MRGVGQTGYGLSLGFVRDVTKSRSEGRTPSPGPKPDKNRPATQSTPSPDPKKKKSPLAAGADESSMHSGRNFDALVGMDSLT
jgi:hypothetical protein